MFISHLLIVDDILIFCDGSRHDIDKLCEGITLFKMATGMMINDHKYTINFASMEVDEIHYITSKLPFQVLDLDVGMKYIGFQLNTND